VKRDWWQCWEEENPPPCDFVLMSWDTAFEKNNRADYSACTVWGVFYQAGAPAVEIENETEEQRVKLQQGLPQANIILLNAYRDRLEFPELKRTVMEEYKQWEPDSIIIEKKASGAPLIYELRSMGIPVQEFTPTKGNDKISRLNAVSDIFASGKVWYPPTRWAEEVIEEIASFPAGEHDDYVDSTSMALMRFRKGGYIRTAMDEPDDYYDTKEYRAYRQYSNKASYY
jgi:predicted phage terminase large subunit-like protein